MVQNESFANGRLKQITAAAKSRPRSERHFEPTWSTAFAFCMSALALTAWCAAIGQGWIAAVVGGGTIATVAAALVYKGHFGQQE
jgi:hypothetical protein